MVNGWTSLQLKDICDFRRGSFPQPYGNPAWYGGEGEMPFVQVADVSDNMRLVPKTKQTISKLAQPMSVFIPTNSVIVTLQGTIGRVALTQYDAYLDRTVLFFMDYKKEIDARFWSYIIKEKFLDEAKRAPGGIIKTITKQALSSFEIELPPIDEQKAIATALSDVDELIANLEKLIEKKKAIKQGVMQELLTGKKRLPGFSKEWVKCKLGELLKYEQPTKYIVRSTDYTENGIPVLTAGKTFVLGYTNETDGIYTNLPVIIFDDFVTTSKFVDFRFKVKSSAMKMLTPKSDSVNLRLVFELMQNIGFTPIDHQRHWISRYSKFEISIPSDLEEQKALAAVFSDMDIEINKLECKLDKYRLVKQGMMQKLLTGEIRLV